MMAKTHKLGGTAAGLGIISTRAFLPNVGMNSFFGMIPFMAGCYLGSLIPDIDSTSSTFSKKYWMFAWPYHLMQYIINAIIRNSKNKVLKEIKRTVNHRGLAHWISLNVFGILILIFTTYLLTIGFGIDFTIKINLSDINETMIPIILNVVFNFLYGLFIGCSSHILLDSLNPTGVPLLAPFSFKRISFGNIETSNSSHKELRFRFMLKLVVIVLFIYCIYTFLLSLSIIDNSFVPNNINKLISLIK